MEKLVIKRGRTAIRRSKISTPLRVLIERDKVRKKRHRIFDFGHGRGDDMAKLREFGYDVSGWDPNYYVKGYSINKLSNLEPGLYNWIHCGYVLNVIEDIEERREVVDTIYSLLPVGGSASFAVRSIRDILSSRNDGWIRYKDGWITGIDTFQCGFSPSRLLDMLAKSRFSTVELVSKNPIVAIAGKENETV